jgi:hypothetical protein
MMTGNSSKRCCGGAAQAFHGEIFHRTSDRGRPCSTVSIDGRKPASGSAYSWHFRQIVMTSGIVSTARSTARTSMLRVEKGGRGAGHRSVARRTFDQGASGGRRAWSAAALLGANDTTFNLPRDLCLKPSPSVCWPIRRTTQTTYAMRSLHREPRQSFHPRQVVPKEFSTTRSCTKPVRNRVYDQPAQAGSSFCNAIREDSAQLCSRGRARLRASVAKNLRACLRGFEPT